MKDYVELGPTGLAIRIFKTKKAAVLYQVMPSRGLAPEPIIQKMEHSTAIGQIRRQVYERDERKCVSCGQELIWDRGSWNSVEMDECKPKGRCTFVEGEYRSGEVSVENCQSLCRNCHQGRGGKHDRSPSFSSSSGRIQRAEPNP